MLLIRTVNKKQEPNIQITIDKLTNILKYICITMIIMHHLAIALIAIIMKLKGRRDNVEQLHTAMYTVYTIIHYSLYNVVYLAHAPLSRLSLFSKVLDYLKSILETRDTCGCRTNGCRTSPSLLNLLVSLARNRFMLGFREFLRHTFNWIQFHVS